MDIATGVIGGVGAVANVAMNARETLNSLTGKLPRAMLFVPKATSNYAYDNKKASGMENRDVQALRDLLKSRYKSSTMKGLGVSKAMKAAQQVAPGELAGNEDLSKKLDVKKASYNDIVKALGNLEGNPYSVMQVQYNPSSIQYRSISGAIRSVSNAGDSGMTEAKIFDGTKQTTLSVQLVFQDLNVSDAFLYEGLSPSISGIYETATSILNNTMKDAKWGGMVGGGYSVQVPVEGLLSLLHFKRTKQVIFVWSDMFFHGELTTVSAQYRMFNKLGHPVLATVDMSIDEPDDTARYASDTQSWRKAFDTLFGNAGIRQTTSV